MMSFAELQSFLGCMTQTSDVKMRCALKLTKIVEARGQYARNLLELEKLKIEASASQTKKGAQPASAGAPQGAGSAKAVSEQEVDDGAKELAAAVAELERLDERLERERAQCRQVAWQLGAEKSALRDRTVTQAEVDKWSSVRLVCSSKTVRDKALLRVFLASLAEAPCLAALELSLGNKARTRKALRQVLDALPTAPANIKEIALTFGHSSLGDVVGLLGHVKGHLQKLSVAAPYQHAVYDTPDALQRFWTAVEETGVTTLDVAGPCLQLQDAAGVQLHPSKWRVETLKACVSAHGQRTLLAALVRANAASLRDATVMGLSMTADDSAAVFSALTECERLEAVSVPCCKDVALLERCAALTKLSIVAGNLMLESDDSAREAVAAAAKLLARPGVVARVDSLELAFFKFGCISREAALPVLQAARGMAKLKSLTVDFCAGFDAELQATLHALPLLEELKLNDDTWPPQAFACIAPANAPSLQTLRLRAGMLGGAQAAVPRAVEKRFAVQGRSVHVHVEEEVAERSPASSEYEDDDGLSDDVLPDASSSDEDTPRAAPASKARGQGVSVNTTHEESSSSSDEGDHDMWSDEGASDC